MKPERWQRIEELYHEALERDPAERTAFVGNACESDEDLRREVESLLGFYQEDTGFMDKPVVEKALQFAIESDNSLAGQQIGHYRVLSLLGEGGMGEVYLAEDTSLRRKVALKLLPTHLTEDKERLLRFRQEARAASALNHPNILTIHEIGEANGHHFIATEFIEGETLRDRMEKSRIEVNTAVDIAIQVASAVAAAHHKGIVHRDIKPENIMVRDDGIVKVLDFGLAKLTKDAETTPETSTMVHTNPGVFMGTVRYMSPEQARAEAADARTDIWSLGVVLYEALSGRVPHDGNSTAEVLASILKHEPPSLTETDSFIPHTLARIVQKCLEKDRANRYQSANELLNDLTNVRREVATGKTDEKSTALMPVMKRPTARLWPRAAVVLLVAGLVATALTYIFYIRPSAVSGESDIRSIAVLPFQNLSGDPSQDHVVAGVHDALIGELSHIKALRVISRRSVMQYQNSEKPIPEIAKDLNVNGIVEGTVTRKGNSVSVQVRFIRALPEERSLGTHSLERSISEIPRIGGEVARAIASNIDLGLTGSDEARFAKVRRVSPETYELYLKGMFFLNKRGRENIEQGLGFLNEATEKDPGDAFAYAGVALGYALLGHGPAPIEVAWPRAKAAALRAVTLDPDLAEAHLALAEVRMYYEWDWPGAEESFLRALELNPNLATAHYHYAWYLALFGRIDEAIAVHIRAKELDPFTLGHIAWLGALYNSQGRHDEAIAMAEEALAVNREFPPGLIVLGNAYAEKGMFREAIETHEKLRAVAPAWKLTPALTYARAGRMDDVQKIVAELEADPPGPWRSFSLGFLYVVLGEKERAFDAWAYEPHHAFLPWAVIDPTTASVRDDPRFEALLARMKLPRLDQYKNRVF